MSKDLRLFIASENISQSAGGILVDKNNDKICLIKNIDSNEWLLPKGRIENNETIQETAKREVYEETGYKCNVKDFIGLQIRPMKDNSYKIINWYLCILESSIKINNTQEIYENFITKWYSYNDCIDQLTFSDDKNIVREILKVLKN